jgi:hypothetical protein
MQKFEPQKHQHVDVFEFYFLKIFLKYIIMKLILN